MARTDGAPDTSPYGNSGDTFLDQGNVVDLVRSGANAIRIIRPVSPTYHLRNGRRVFQFFFELSLVGRPCITYILLLIIDAPKV